MLVFWCNVGMRTEINSRPAVEDDLSIKRLLDQGGALDIVEHDNDAAHGFEWSPCVYRGMLIYEVPYRRQVLGGEDVNVVEICD